MMRFIFILYLVITCFGYPLLLGENAAWATSAASPGASEATTTDSSGTAGNGTTPGGNCDFSAIKKSLYGTESGGDCSKLCSGKCTTGASGKYQFIPATRNTYINKHPECNGQSCNSDAAWPTPGCCQVQECIMNAYLADSLATEKSDPDCQTLLNSGQSYTGSGQGQTLTCVPTESGLLGAMHLGGNGAGKGGVCARILHGSGGSSDSFGTSLIFYMCKHKDLPVPGSCSGNASPPGDPQPPGTQLQIDTGSFVSTGGPLDPLKEWWVWALQQMAEQFTVNMVAQAESIGMLLDAKHQLETQRLFQQLSAQAHKDYQPSEQMCTFGTFARDLATSDRNASIAHVAISNEILQRELGEGDSKASTQQSDTLTRMSQFVKRFCNPGDNGNGLKNLCPTAAPTEMQNRDINYTATLDMPLSLKINMTDTDTTEDEEAVFALVDNLFMHDPTLRISAKDMALPENRYRYMNLRSIIAMRGIARNSISNIIAMKSETPNQARGSAPFLKSLMQEFGMSEEEITKFLGDNPSYYAQMELLTKKMYQNPTFYTELYDKPTNVKRIRAAMQAIKLMQDRDIEEALHRREMLLSMMLELRLREQADAVYNATEGALYEKH